MLYQLFWLFLAFSFLGWYLEVAATAVRLGQYRDRGVLHGPLCLVYGITGCLITIALRELSGGGSFCFCSARCMPRWWNGLPGICWSTTATPAGGITLTANGTWMGTSAFRLPSSGVPWAW